MRIVILHASVGHGHTKVAEAVREGLVACGVSQDEVVLLDTLAETPPWFRILYTSIYYYSVRNTPWAWRIAYGVLDLPIIYQNMARYLRRWANHLISGKLVRRMIQEKADAVISTHFLAPEVLGSAKQAGKISSLLVTVITDFLPHTVWVNPGTDHYWVMSEEGRADLEERGVPAERITVGGIPVCLRFRPQGKKKEFRKKEGLDEDRFTILITSGSFGLGPDLEVLDALLPFGGTIQVIVVCGRNRARYRLLRNQSYPFPIRLHAFVSNMDELMEASDLAIAKPGGSTTTESLAKGIPMAVLEPIPGQETRNARVLKARNVSFFLGAPSDIRIVLKSILDYPEVLEEKKRSLQRLANAEAAIDLARFVLERIKK